MSIRPEDYVFPDDPKQSLYSIKLSDLDEFTDEQIMNIVDDPAEMLAACDHKVAMGMIESINVGDFDMGDGHTEVFIEAEIKEEWVERGCPDERVIRRETIIRVREPEALYMRDRAKAQYSMMKDILDYLHVIRAHCPPLSIMGKEC